MGYVPTAKDNLENVPKQLKGEMQCFMGKTDIREAANDEVVTGEMTKEGKGIC